MNARVLDYYMSLPYKIELIPDEEGTTFTAVIPDLKGCASFGETVQEAYEMVTHAKRLWIETALDKGWPIPEPKAEQIRIYSGRFTVRLARYLHRELVELAEAEDTSLNQLVVALLSEGAERHRSSRRAKPSLTMRWIELLQPSQPLAQVSQHRHLFGPYARVPDTKWPDLSATIFWIQSRVQTETTNPCD